MKLSISLFFLCNILSFALVGQDFQFVDYKEQKSSVGYELDEYFVDYDIVQFDFDFDQMKKKSGKVIRAEFDFGEFISIELYPSYIVGDDTFSKSSQSVSAMPYYGYDDDNVISLTFGNNFIYGFIRNHKLGEVNIEPLSFYTKAAKNYYLIYKTKDIVSQNVKCGVNDINKQSENLSGRVLKASSCEIVDLAIACDFGMFERYGSVEAVENHNIAVMNCVNTNFIDQFNINVEFHIATQFIPTTTGADPFSNTTDINMFLNEFISWTSGAPWSSGFDMYQVWTSRDVGGGSIGLAQTPGDHHLLEDYSFGASLRSLTAHEIGHNFNALHVGSQTIMFPNVVLTDTWDATSVSSINSRLSSIANSLTDCTLSDSPNARIYASSMTLCQGGVIRLVDKSDYGTSRTWATTGGAISSTSDESITFSATTDGTYTVTLTSTNAQGSDEETIDLTYTIDSPNHCIPSTTSYGIGGLGSWSIIEGSNVVFSHNSGFAYETGNYENFYCSSLIELDENTTYTISYSTEFCPASQYFKLYIDYNNDGDFIDAGESEVSSDFFWCGSPITQGTNGQENGLIFTTPSSPTMNTGLRLRVIVDNNFQAPASTCYSPTTGQIEDYLVVFGELSSCTDGQQNGNETGVDCGGPDCPACPTCMDMTMNGNETGVDCGGPDCPACPTCTDGIQNGNETDVDCGGIDCVPCVYGCTIAAACNYNPSANINTGCEYTSCAGCTEVFATNYDPTKTINNGSCTYDCTDSFNSIASNPVANDTIITSATTLSTSGTITVNYGNPLMWRSTNAVEINANTTIDSELTIDVGPCNNN